MRKLPTILAGLFVVITLFRVATFAANSMHAGWMGWAFSVGLGLAVYLSAYWTRVSAVSRDGTEDRRSKNTRRVAWLALILFASADGYFNLSEVLLTVTSPELRTAATIYGIFPTLAAALLGALQGYVDRLPIAPQKHNINTALRARIASWLNPAPDAVHYLADPVHMQTDAVHPGASAMHHAQDAQVHVLAKVHECEPCSLTFANHAQYAAHMRWTHAPERKNGNGNGAH